MTGVDLNAFRFDHDLTFAVLLANADGTVYHRYGSRDETGADTHLSLEALAKLLEQTKVEHVEYEKASKPPAPRPVAKLEDVPLMAKKLAAKPQKCLHCHTVYDAWREQALADGTWSRDAIWRWPRPEQVGLVLSRDDLGVVTSVTPGSIAASGGALAGDLLLSANGRRILTEADLQEVMDRIPVTGGPLALELERARKTISVELALPDGWRRGTPLSFSWRPSMWGLRPTPGFGGKQLDPDELAKLGLEKGAFAIRVNYVVDWGDHPEDGRSALEAGVRKGDVVVEADGKSDFASHQHFQSWFRLTRKPGTTCELVLLRDGKRVKVSLPVLP